MSFGENKVNLLKLSKSIGSAMNFRIRKQIGRRSFLYTATTAVGATGLVAAAWPLLDQMNPDAATRATGDIVGVNVASWLPGELRRVQWRNLPIFIVKRTIDMLEAMQEQKFVSILVDPLSESRQQPPYAKNWHRSINPEYAVLIGVCTYCKCILRYFADDASPPDLNGGYICPCCASHYDPAGRTYHGITKYNLPVPPHDIVDQSEILIGKNASSIIFSIESLERI
jgi:ubiquinol-cytochrome c reductase iron-sulfur subunit